MKHVKSKRSFSFSRRAAGLLLHPTSLPGPHGCGDLGPAAYEFVDFMAAAGLTWWQMLPIGPPAPSGSPYSAYSAFAGSPLLVDLTALAEEGLLTRRDIAAPRELAQASRVPYPQTAKFRSGLLRKAYAAFVAAGGENSRELAAFVKRQEHWLAHHALYAALRAANGNTPWPTWPKPQRLGEAGALRAAQEQLAAAIGFEIFVQYQFDRQWNRLREYGEQRGVGLIGDIPIFIGYDSSDVWAQRSLFTLEGDGRLKLQSGVPPDGFSATGQLWRHPLYRWPAHERDGFAWWISRFRHTFAQFHAVRIDHFLGFARCWAVPGKDQIALHGRWVATPGEALLSAVTKALGRVEIIAEDLGDVSDEAIRLRDLFEYPGMRVLHWAFGTGPGARYNQPHSYPRTCVAYTGTHDNNTTMGWWDELQRARKPRRSSGKAALREWDALSPRERALRYLKSDGREVHWDAIRAVIASPANTAIVPVQDLLGLDGKHRMNLPATSRGNWQWRYERGALTAAIAKRLRALNEAYDRT